MPVFDWYHVVMFAAGVAVPMLQQLIAHRQAVRSGGITPSTPGSPTADPQLTIGHGLLLHLIANAVRGVSSGPLAAPLPTPVLPGAPTSAPTTTTPQPLPIDLNALVQSFFAHMALQQQNAVAAPVASPVSAPNVPRP